MSTEKDTTSAASVVRPERFCHVVLKTLDKARLRDFYVKALGMFVQHEAEDLAFLTYDDEHHRLAIAQLPPIARRHGFLETGMAHFAFAYPSLESLADAYEARKALGILPFWCINHGMTMSMYYSDPDGNEFECQVDLMDNDQCNAYMTGPKFAANPIGVDYDPEEFVKQVRSGVPHAEITAIKDVKPRTVLSIPSGRYGKATPWTMAKNLVDAWGSTVIAAGALAYIGWSKL
ncbi:Glyoxalase/Bleomycin resistance protein/Dihydroxybiphenyl dioxygenase [Hyaloraphidium curvatum]|nr:Glyoxalase/Bleomycin resistance protein/Dihydroxybiphenyl dioxygenase [Hyaloraphidium curvatum]